MGLTEPPCNPPDRLGGLASHHRCVGLSWPGLGPGLASGSWPVLGGPRSSSGPVLSRRLAAQALRGGGGAGVPGGSQSRTGLSAAGALEAGRELKPLPWLLVDHV